MAANSTNSPAPMAAPPPKNSSPSWWDKVKGYGKDAYHGAETAVDAIGNKLYQPPPPNVGQSPAGSNLAAYAADLNRQRQEFQARAAPTVQENGPGAGAQARSLQLQESAARGEQPSAAESLYRQGADEAARRQLGAAAALQGSNPGEALRAGLSGAAQTELQSSAGAAALRAQEMATARSGFQTGADTARSQDVDVGKANAGADLTEQGLNNNYQLGLDQQTGNALKNDTDVAETDADRQARANAGNQTVTGSLLGGAGQALGAAFSDKTAKKDIKPATREAQDFLDQLEPKKYQWKDPSDPRTSGPGEHLGVIAQDLLKSSTVTGPDGKKYISGDVIGQVLAGMGALNKRVDAVTKGKG